MYSLMLFTVHTAHILQSPPWPRDFSMLIFFMWLRSLQWPVLSRNIKVCLWRDSKRRVSCLGILPLSPADPPVCFHVCRYVQVSIEVRLLFLMSGCLNLVLNFVRCSLLDFLMWVIAVQIESVRSTTFFGLVWSWMAVSVVVRSACASVL